MQPSRFVQAVVALPDPIMRAKVLVEALASSSDEQLTAWIQTFAELIHNLHRRDFPGLARSHAMVAVETITLTFAANLDYDVRRAVYQRAVDLGRVEISRLLFSVPPTTAAIERKLKALDSERALRPKDRALSLGERKALARTGIRDTLMLIAKDPHPMVIAILLDNPKLTEPDVVRVASTRPAMAEALELIANHPRWRGRTQVKRALVFNPHCATATAVRMMTGLPLADLREIQAAGSVAPLLVAHAELLARIG